MLQLVPPMDDTPRCEESERAILGQVLQDPAVLTRSLADFDPRWFWRADHRRLFEELRRIQRSGETFDMVTLPGHLSQMGLASACGGLDYVVTLPDSAPSTANTEHYSARIRQMYARREALSAAEDIRRIAGRGDIAEIQDAAMRAARRVLAAGAGGGEAVDLTEVMDDVLEAAHMRADPATASDREAGGLISTGWPVLDGALGGGMRRGSCYVIAARPGVGKTGIALDLGLKVAQASRAEGWTQRVRPESVLFLSLEMTPEELSTRALARASRVDHTRIASGTMSGDEWARVTQARDDLDETPIRIYHRRGATGAECVGRIHAEAARHPLRMVVLDYAQIVRVRGDGLRYDQLIGQMVQEVQAACAEVGAVFVLLAQIGRAGARVDGPPRMHHIKESGDIEQEAYAVLLLDRPGLRGEEVAPQVLHIGIDKVRSGSPCTLIGSFYGATMEVQIDRVDDGPRHAPHQPDPAWGSTPQRRGKMSAHPGGTDYAPDDGVPF